MWRCIVLRNSCSGRSVFIEYRWEERNGSFLTEVSSLMVHSRLLFLFHLQSSTASEAHSAKHSTVAWHFISVIMVEMGDSQNHYIGSFKIWECNYSTIQYYKQWLVWSSRIAMLRSSVRDVLLLSVLLLLLLWRQLQRGKHDSRISWIHPEATHLSLARIDALGYSTPACFDELHSATRDA